MGFDVVKLQLTHHFIPVHDGKWQPLQGNLPLDVSVNRFPVVCIFPKFAFIQIQVGIVLVIPKKA